MRSFLPMLLAIFCTAASAQTVNTIVRFDKDTKQGLMLYLPYSQEVAEGTILTRLKEIGFEPESSQSLFWKQRKLNGFYVYKGVVLKGENQHIVDLYFKVESRGNRKEAQSVMYLLTSKGGDDFVTNTSDAAVFTAAQNFLNSFATGIASYKQTLDVQAQEETVKKTVKKLADLQEEERELTKKIARLQEDLRKNKEAQVSQQAIVENEQKKLQNMRTMTQ